MRDQLPIPISQTLNSQSNSTPITNSNSNSNSNSIYQSPRLRNSIIENDEKAIELSENELLNSDNITSGIINDNNININENKEEKEKCLNYDPTSYEQLYNATMETLNPTLNPYLQDTQQLPESQSFFNDMLNINPNNINTMQTILENDDITNNQNLDKKTEKNDKNHKNDKNNENKSHIERKTEDDNDDDSENENEIDNINKNDLGLSKTLNKNIINGNNDDDPDDLGLNLGGINTKLTKFGDKNNLNMVNDSFISSETTQIMLATILSKIENLEKKFHDHSEKTDARLTLIEGKLKYLEDSSNTNTKKITSDNYKSDIYKLDNNYKSNNYKSNNYKSSPLKTRTRNDSNSSFITSYLHMPMNDKNDNNNINNIKKQIKVKLSSKERESTIGSPPVTSSLTPSTNNNNIIKNSINMNKHKNINISNKTHNEYKDDNDNNYEHKHAEFNYKSNNSNSSSISTCNTVGSTFIIGTNGNGINGITNNRLPIPPQSPFLSNTNTNTNAYTRMYNATNSRPLSTANTNSMQFLQWPMSTRQHQPFNQNKFASNSSGLNMNNIGHHHQNIIKNESRNESEKFINSSYTVDDSTLNLIRSLQETMSETDRILQSTRPQSLSSLRE